MTVRNIFLFVLFLATSLISAQNTTPSSEKLIGEPIGSKNVDYSTGKPSTTVNTPACAFDGDLTTFYASYDRSRTWVGLDLGTAHVITRVGWCPRNSQPSRVQLGLFEGSNSPDFLDAVPLYLIPNAGQDKTMEYADVPVTRGFRYVRYVGPNEARCNIGELEFYGYEGEGTDSLWYQITQLPTVSIHTYAGYDPQDKVTEMESNITITYDSGTRIQEAPITARGRGNASWSFPKKPYRIKFTDKSRHMLKGSAQESPAKAKKWTLINNYGDKTLMRNCLAFEVSRRIEAPYTPYCQLVDVLMNGEYKGTYQLCDQISVDKDRVPITEMETTDNEEPELTGGYLIEVDAYASQETSWFNSAHSIPVTIKSPQDDDITTEQRKYIRNYFNLMESAAWSSNYTDTIEGYRHYLDTESFLKHFLIGEFSGNTDVYWSTYMYKDREETQFHVAPSWDFDLAFNNDNRIYPVSNRSDWVFRSGGSCAGNMASLVTRILSDKRTDQELRAMWKNNRKEGILDEKTLVAYVDSLAEVMDASQRLNFTRWPILDQTVHCNVTARGSFEAEVDVLRNYIPTRLTWIDNYLGVDSGIEYNDSTYYISTPEQLIEFAKAVNGGAMYSNGYLTEDLDFSEVGNKFIPIGSGSKPFRGKFDGQGHRISNLHIEGANNTGFFGTVSGGADISDFIFDSTCSIYGNAFVGVIGASTGSGAVTMSRIGNEADITAQNQNAGGIIGCNYGSNASFIITDCYNAGNITGGNESATISGWVGSGAVITNCYNIGTIQGYNYGNDFYRGGASTINCYSIKGTQVKRFTQEQQESGELCYLLNGGNTEDPVWRQTIGTDPHPTLDSLSLVVYEAEDYTYYNARILRGDVDDSGVIDRADADWLLLHLIGETPEGFVLVNADVNDDGEINICDLVELQRIIKGDASSTNTLTARLYAGNASVKAAGSRKVTIWISCNRQATAYEADIILSQGLSIDTASVAFATKTNTTAHYTSLLPTKKGYHLISYAADNTPLGASTGTALTFSMLADSTFTGGTFAIKGQHIVAADGVACSSTDVEYDVTLAKTYVTNILLSAGDIDIVAGNDTLISAVILPELATIKTLKWSSSNAAVATVDENGLVTAVSAGSATIKAAATDGSYITRTLRIRVYEDEDGIGQILADEDNHMIYTLSGLRLTHITQSAFYIIDGRKRFVNVR